jgi:SOS-response transcriptional repressor LexA
MTPRQRRAYDFIAEFWDEFGFAPSYREIQMFLGLKSVSGVARLVKALEARRFVRLVPHTKRSIEVIDIKDRETF